MDGFNMGMLAAMMQGADPNMMAGMMGEGNPLAFPEVTKEDMEKFKKMQEFNMKMVEGNATEQDFEEAKKIFGEAEVASMKAAIDEMSEEERKGAVDSHKMYSSVVKSMQDSFKESSIDNSDPEAIMKSMSSAFTKLLSEQKDNPEFKELMNSLGQTVYNKELLYPPFLKLKEEFPKWLEEHKGKIPKDQFDRHTAQYELAKQMCELFEEGENDVMKMMDLASRMPQHGPLPEEFLIDLPSFGDGMPDMSAMGMPMPGMPMPAMPMSGMGMPGMGMPGSGMGPSI
eukprot:TRINITY_DN829_c0_g1_i9.p3 TRINITY_DN829_c0_g1~~TRINITY_DN829_c0_g1_i9.p3  ORF type:complete len:285 (+),score=105.62 TRINITY_DN829_c0_g1_i9:376-1230(+)